MSLEPKKIRFIRGLARLSGWAWSQQGAVLCLHSVRNETVPAGDFDPMRRLTISPGFLQALVVELRAQNIALVSLAEAMRRLRRGKAAGRFVALTFDDGYAGNYHQAFPVLARLGVPFTVFLTTGFVDRSVPMWWLGLEEFIRNQDALNLPGRTIPSRTTAEKLSAFGEADQLLRAIPRAGIGRFWRRLCALNDSAKAAAAAFSGALDWQQVRAMAGTGLVGFGCHTVSHPTLARLDEANCRAEIEQSRDRIAAELGRTPEFFAYPYGGEADIGADAPKLVAAAGFRAAFTTSRRLLRHPGSAQALHTVPRLVLEDEDLALARAHISGLPWTLRDAGRALVPARVREPA